MRSAPPSLSLSLPPAVARPLRSLRARVPLRQRALLLLLLCAACAVLILPPLASCARLAGMRLAAFGTRTAPSAPLPVVVPGLLAARWREAPTDEPALFLKLHVFSDDSAEGRRRRDAIRELSPAAWVTEKVELRFVVPDSALLDGRGNGTEAKRIHEGEGEGGTRARARASAGAKQRTRGPERLPPQQRESALEAESAQFGDVLRVPGRDTVVEWIRAAAGPAAAAEAPARWVVKCDDTVSSPSSADADHRLCRYSPTSSPT